MIYWKTFRFQNNNYSLEHLHPRVWLYEQHATESKPAIQYRIRVIYSLHCFTVRRDENLPELDYSDDREVRTFCFDRYLWSKHLNEIIENLGEGYVYHTGRQNFLRVRSSSGTEYEVFFTLIKSKEQEIDLQLYVQSAYLRTRGSSPQAGKIRFAVIAYNTKSNKPIKVFKR